MATTRAAATPQRRRDRPGSGRAALRIGVPIELYGPLFDFVRARNTSISALAVSLITAELRASGALPQPAADDEPPQ